MALLKGFRTVVADAYLLALDGPGAQSPRYAMVYAHIRAVVPPQKEANLHAHICGGVGTGWAYPEGGRSRYRFDESKGCGFVWEHEDGSLDNHLCPRCGMPCEKYRASDADLAAHRLNMYHYFNSMFPSRGKRTTES